MTAYALSFAAPSHWYDAPVRRLTAKERGRLTDLTPALVRSALAGDTAAVQAVVDSLTPVIQARVARALLRRKGAAQGRNVRQEIEDLTQDCFVALFRADGKLLRGWDPERGMALKSYVGLVAEQQVSQVLRSRRRSPWTEDPTEDSKMPSDTTVSSPEDRAATRQALERLLVALKAELSPQGLQMFQLLMVQQRPVPEICEATGLSADAVYAWRSRLKRTVRRVAGNRPGAG